MEIILIMYTKAKINIKEITSYKVKPRKINGKISTIQPFKLCSK